eukprot:CAMPEP_0179207282 /NCGR_PEP_ID=MMETSP0796-20121207/103359_1 /TAXON_ID=73915 /ORGANISM="Pyrodinium bahamense, Strain pbaha01" /LENGTH=38 /DNA_ID= /DNA_START= /DNA_END= /DNA_ORIENTATION=
MSKLNRASSAASTAALSCVVLLLIVPYLHHCLCPDDGL